MNIKTKNIENLSRKTYKLSEKKINMDNISRNTISFNQINKKPNKAMVLEQLKSMVKKLSREEILEIFEEIKSTKVLLSEADLNLIEQETNYKIIHDILISIFFYEEKYNEADKKNIIELFTKDRKNILYFIKVLNDHRTKGDFVIPDFTLKYLGELFKIINDITLSKNDMELFKYIFILSMTYYNLKKDQTKIYLFSYIKDHPDYQKVKFWNDYLQELINHDLKVDIKNKKIENLKKEEKEQLINCYFSNFLSVIKAMADFKMTKKFVRDFVENNREKYYLSKEQIENACMIFDVSLNENEDSYNGDNLNKDTQKDNINNDIDNSRDNKEENKKDSIIIGIKEKEIAKEENLKEKEIINDTSKHNIKNNIEDVKENEIENNKETRIIDENKKYNPILNKNNINNAIIEESAERENENENENENTQTNNEAIK